MKDRIATKTKQHRGKYRKALDLGKESGAGWPNHCYVLQRLLQNVKKIASRKKGTNLMKFQTHSMALVMTIIRVEASTMGNTGKY